MSSSETLAQRAKEIAFALGFDLAGVARAEPGADTERLREWIGRGYAGSMDWMSARIEERVDPRRVLDGARSVLMVGLVYRDGSDEARPGVGLARYAGGDDYHEVVLDRLRAVGAALEVEVGHAIGAKAYVDTGPVAERALAARGGLGWIGKNGCLIDPTLGSWFFLGALLLDVELDTDAPIEDHCGSCTACLDACPTAAFAEPYVLDATRCIAYTTIEDPGPIPEALREGHGELVFGCDICQEVCPWNQRRARPELPDPLGLRERLALRAAWREMSLARLLGTEEASFLEVTRHSAVRRTKWRGLMRNALVAAGNSGDMTLVAAIETHARGQDALLAEHARWALKRLSELDAAAD